MHGLGHVGGSLRGQPGVRARDPDEAHRGQSMLRLRRSRVQVFPQGLGEEGPQVGGVGVRQLGRAGGGMHRLSSAQQEGSVIAGARGPCGQVGGRSRREDDLPGIGRLLRVGRLRGRRPEDDELAGGLADEEQQDAPGVDADRHVQVQSPHRRGDGGGLPKRPLHLDHRVAGALGVTFPAEEQQERVTAELQQVAAAREGAVQHAAEHPVQRLDNLLGTDPSALGELLGEGRETGDVREHQGPVEVAPAFAGHLVVPGEHDARHVPSEVSHRTSSRCGARVPALGARGWWSVVDRHARLPVTSGPRVGIAVDDRPT